MGVDREQRRSAPRGARVTERAESSAAEPRDVAAALQRSMGNGAVQRLLAGNVQRRGAQRPPAYDAPPEAIHAAARRGVATAATALPFAAEIQRAFGGHDIGALRAHQGPAAAAAATAMGAGAYATGDDIVFAQTPDLHTVAHEAAHAVQQRAGVTLPGGVGREGDAYEQHADAVADLVVQGRSAAALLDQYATPVERGNVSGASASVQPMMAPGSVVQRGGNNSKQPSRQEIERREREERERRRLERAAEAERRRLEREAEEERVRLERAAVEERLARKRLLPVLAFTDNDFGYDKDARRQINATVDRLAADYPEDIVGNYDEAAVTIAVENARRTQLEPYQYQLSGNWRGVLRTFNELVGNARAKRYPLEEQAFTNSLASIATSLFLTGVSGSDDADRQGTLRR